MLNIPTLHQQQAQALLLSPPQDFTILSESGRQPLSLQN